MRPDSVVAGVAVWHGGPPGVSLQEGEFYHYRFTLGGKDYHGSTKWTAEREACASEKEQIEDVRGILREETPREAVPKLYDRARTTIGGAERASLADASSVSIEQPSRRGRGQAHAKATRSRWEDTRCGDAAEDDRGRRSTRRGLKQRDCRGAEEIENGCI